MTETVKRSQFDQGFAKGLAFAGAVARVSARTLYAKGAETKWQAAGDALSELADGIAMAIHAPPVDAAPAAAEGQTAGEDPAQPVLPPAAAPAIAAPAALAAVPVAARREVARASGYTGDICDQCQNMMMVRNGTCLKCEACGATTGCS